MLNTEDLAPHLSGFATSAGLHLLGGGWGLEEAKRASREGKAIYSLRNHMISRGFWGMLPLSGTILVHIHIITLLSRHFEFS